MISDRLKTELLKKGVAEEALETVVEMEFNQFRRGMVAMADVYYTNYLETLKTLNSVADIKDDHHVLYYATTDGAIGYVVLDKKQIGFYHGPQK